MSQNTFLYHRNFANKEGDYAYPIPSEMTQARKPQIDWPSNNSKKIGVTPGAIVGALVGAGIAKHNVEKELKQKQIRDNALNAKQTPNIDGNYYSQVKSIMNNLEVIFTPMSVIYTINNKNNKFTLDTIETGEMNTDMKNAWKSKNKQYFKDLLVSKMYSEMQMAEVGFAKSFLKKSLAVKDEITKDASDTSWIDDIQDYNLIDRVKLSSQFFPKDEFGEKIASAIVDDMNNEDPVEYIDLKMNRPFDKYAGILTGIKDCLGLHSDNVSIKKTIKDLENPKTISKKIKVGFLPDRVVFSADNQLVSTLPLISMNEDGYGHFQKQDSKYFKNLFVENVKTSINKKENEKESSEITIEYIEKMANDNTMLDSNPLLSSDTHPVVIYLFLTVKLGVEWLNYDIAIIERIIKSEFSLTEIPEATLNKIFTILTANQSMNVYEVPYAFEKAVLSLCSKPVEFLDNQKKSIKMQDIAFAIDVLDRITPYDDIYDNFSNAVLNYICDILSDQDLYVYNPTSIIGSNNEPIFNSKINELLLKAIKGKMTLESNNNELDNEVFDKCDFVADNSLLILNSIRRYIKDNPNLDIETFQDGKLIDTIMKKRKLLDNPLSNLIKKQVIKNLALDSVLDIYDNGLQNQIKQFNIYMPEGVNN